MNFWGSPDQVQQYGFFKMGKENLLIRSGTAGTKLNGRKKYNKYYYFINTHKSFISLFSYGTEKNECVKKVKIGYKMVQKLIICGKKSLFSLIIFALLKYLLSLYSLMMHRDSFPVVINSKLNPRCSL